MDTVIDDGYFPLSNERGLRKGQRVTWFLPYPPWQTGTGTITLIWLAIDTECVEIAPDEASSNLVRVFLGLPGHDVLPQQDVNVNARE